MSRNIETKLSYIKRKLNSAAYNNAACAAETEISAMVLCNIASGKTKSPSFENVEKIYQYFKGLK